MQGPGKDWEHTKLTKNSKPVLLDLHVKSGDLVKVIAGADKGKVGKITKVNRKTGQVVMEGVNLRTKHVKPMGEEEEGQIVKVEFPVHHSNVQHYSEAQGVVSRIGHKMEGDKKVRYLKKTGEVLAN
jgi:large subunit ribosomal protein L24